MTRIKLMHSDPIEVLRRTLEGPLFQRFTSTCEEIETTKYPPTDVRFIEPDDGNPFYIIEMAVSGFSKKDLTVTCESSIVKISGSKLKDIKEESLPKEQHILKQMATRKFTRGFTFGSAPIEVKKAKCKDGILYLEVHFISPPEGDTIPIA